MKIAIGSDHRGVDVARRVMALLVEQGHGVASSICGDERASDYPDMAYAVSSAVANGEAELGVLVCGSGIGMSIAANKVRGVRAALVHDEVGAEQARSHADANVLCLPADLLGMRLIERIVMVFVSAEFSGGRHERRVSKIEAIESGAYAPPAEGTGDATDPAGEPRADLASPESLLRRRG
ncbi:MAG: ribose 5-phosphate isomerase B [Planctomycetota bacterium]